ncbi:MAG: radical SAM protein [Candidatus Lokiarchaeota archaeon]|nr:radical SAM protein [Candidatus Lokiarchaeota archaeon]MBD3340269.1 radical SAM protein [Candidatus Lokiarchaeota archaeon]
MNLRNMPYIPNHISFRRYREIDVYDLKNNESFLIDEEAFSLLKSIDGDTSYAQILQKYPESKKEEIKDALQQFIDLGIVDNKSDAQKLSLSKKTEYSSPKLPNKNPFSKPYLQNIMINITERCNLSCKHCYITDKNTLDMPLERLKALIKDFYKLQGIRLILTGGEPFLYSELKALLEFLKKFPLQKVMLSNGVLIGKDQRILDLLRDNYFEVFVSIDGLEASHNDFRDANCFHDAINGIKTLLDNHIAVSINTMVHKQNLHEFIELYELISSLGEIRNWSIDIPTFDDQTPKEIIDRYAITPKEGGRILKNYGWGVVFESGGVISGSEESVEYACGPHLIAIDVLGNITKCGFFSEQNIGKVFEIGLKKGWKLIQKELNWTLDELECNKINCEFMNDCRGGCRYRALKNSGSVYGVDSFKCYQFGKMSEE